MSDYAEFTRPPVPTIRLPVLVVTVDLVTNSSVDVSTSCSAVVHAACASVRSLRPFAYTRNRRGEWRDLARRRPARHGARQRTVARSTGRALVWARPIALSIARPLSPTGEADIKTLLSTATANVAHTQFATAPMPEAGLTTLRPACAACLAGARLNRRTRAYPHFQV